VEFSLAALRLRFHAGSAGNQLQLEFAINVAALPSETRDELHKKDNQLIAQAVR
jgi:hypothetical protein